MAEHKFYITRLKNLHKHPNADRLQIGECFGNSVIVSLDYQEDQLGVYFPVDLQLSEKFCEINDLVRCKDKDGKQCGGYLEEGKRNIKAVKLRGEKSDGLFLPLTCLAEFTKISDLHEGESYDTLNGEQICCKYIPVCNVVHSYKHSKHHVVKKNICPTFHEHVETEQLAYNLNKFFSGDTIELTLKMHGTSGRTGYLPIIKYKRSWIDKLFNRKGKQYTEYDYINGSRRVVMYGDHHAGYYDSDDFRIAMGNKFKDKLHKGEVVYYEIVGFQGHGNPPIMSAVRNDKISDKEFSNTYGKMTVFSYGCDIDGYYEYDPLMQFDGISGPCCDVYVYRMTMVNEDGEEVEYSPDEIRYRCWQMNVKTVPLFTRVIIPDTINCTPGEYVVKLAENYYNGPDPVGKSHVREGVVVRIVNRNNYEVYKHKNFSFKVLEGIAKDTATVPDIEEAQEV